MRILLTNDDGIFAKGIETLYMALSSIHDVTVVAPETEQSAVGHAITLLDPLRVTKIKRNGHYFGFALTGTPADCVKIAVAELLKTPPEMVISGINHGANVGVNTIYSGTVSAATEAALLGIPAIAISIGTFQPSDFSAAIAFIPKLVEKVGKKGLPPGVSLNVNIPNVPAEKVRGVKITHQGTMQMVTNYDRRIDPRNHIYYWLSNTDVLADPNPSADSNVLADNYISITPINHDLTCYPLIDSLKEWGLDEEY